MMEDHLRRRLLSGLVIPAHPLALDANRRLDEQRQAALTRYYRAAGAGGLAVAVHTCRERQGSCASAILAQAASVTDANSALFDAPNGFAGCIAGLHEILTKISRPGKWRR